MLICVRPIANGRNGVHTLKNSRKRGASDTTRLMKLTLCSNRAMISPAKFMNVTISLTVPCL